MVEVFVCVLGSSSISLAIFDHIEEASLRPYFSILEEVRGKWLKDLLMLRHGLPDFYERRLSTKQVTSPR